MTAWVLIIALIAGFIMPQNLHAETIPATSIDDAATLASGQSIDGIFEQPGVQWYKITPTQKDITEFSHIKLQLTSDQMVNVSVYSSKENAEQNYTFEQYNAGTDMSPDAATINFPIAWKGPYYVKVEYFGNIDEDGEMALADNQDEEQPPVEGGFGPAKFTLSAKDVKLPPSKDLSSGMDCPVEFSTSGKLSGADMLKSIRLFRDGILAKTQEGRNLSSLYYKSAPFIVLKLAMNKSAREEVYKNLVSLQTLIYDLNAGNSSHVISEKEEAAINALFNLSTAAVPAKLKAEMESISKKVDLSNLKGKEVADVAKKAGIQLPTQVKDKYIVKLKPGKKLSSLQSKSRSLSSLDVKNNNQLFDNMYVMELNDDQFSGMSAQSKTKAMKATVSQIEKLPEVEFVEKVQTYKALSADVQSPYQWSLANTGANDDKNDGKKGADIANNKLQNLVKNRSLKDTLIAVVDTGVDYTLADLQGRVRTDIGKNFVDTSATPLDDNGHGTHVSGIIAASAGNGYSIEGINQKAKILPVKVLDASGSGDTESIAYGIKYAVDKGAKVINLSLGGKYSRTLEYALKYAADHNVTVVAASGNDGQYGISYPASSQYAISVGATNSWDLVSDYSNYGIGLDLVAPGTNIPSLYPDGNVTYMSGTSMAAPHVTAVAGLLLSNNAKLKVSDIRTILHDTAKNVAFEEKDNQGEDGSMIDLIGGGGMIDPDDEITLPQGADLVSGFGRLNAFSAVSKVDLHVKLSSIYDNQNKVTGTTVKGAKVEVKKGSAVIGKATAASNGTFSVKIPVQKSNQKLDVIVTDSKNVAQTTFKVFVKKGKAPAAPKVSAISNTSTYVTGTAQPEAKIVVKNAAKKIVAQGKADSKGKFKLKIKKQKAGIKLYVTSEDLAKRVSKATTLVVKDKIAPAAPKVNKVTTKSTAVKGKAEVGSTVTLKYKGKTIGTAKTSKKGNFTIKMKKKPAGATLYLNAKDKAGNTSKSVKIKVKKA